MMKVTDLRVGKKYKFEDRFGVKLLGVAMNFNGDIIIHGTIEWGDEVFLAEWDADGELYRAHCNLDRCNFNLTPIVDLKPCPFCGGDDLKTNTTGECNWYIDCKDCGVFVNTYEKTKTDAIKKWNGRA